VLYEFDRSPLKAATLTPGAGTREGGGRDRRGRSPSGGGPPLAPSVAPLATDAADGVGALRSRPADLVPRPPARPDFARSLRLDAIRKGAEPSRRKPPLAPPRP